ncbi:MAG: DUF5069 domain-containing protein [Candidatus Handelsmanbacteria bacterium RIFCSPLOWO2_12_FULL_64_10]|uniref:DUF5069 domain-containing protein n=1 Tax=Handelsmanbacteria sp. (strain RIFCSPLOWO2_12_FULL_64_10) TaxID=1817868 RepID=A0A1F6C457_HANXR|nr:MAG: DUF5069 domain-containing protein [Candidatus Handelsmanbacteria bacterium RIFCSPLOWO2_12_FULL_64_10]
MASKIVPLISSGVAGPLGVLHLPRLWCKVLLDARGLLPEGHDACGKGYDQMVLDGLGLDREATLKFLRGQFPTYVQFEEWVLAQKGGRLDRAAVDRLNASILGYNHGDATRADILSHAGRKDDGTVKDAVRLNALEDWHDFHAGIK